MFDKMIPIIPKDSLVICDLNETLFTRRFPCEFTDLEGFIQLFKHVKGNVIFLTTHKKKQDIVDRFNYLHLNYNDFTILYTTGSKGLYLKKMRYPRHTVFIDNNVEQIRTVRKHCPDIMCILFEKTTK